MKRVAIPVLLAFLAPVLLAAAQAPQDPLSASLKALYDGVKRNVVESADKVPEADYAFKPTPEVRSFGELFGHIANSNFSSCARVKGEKNPNTGNDFEKTPTKAAIKKALADSFAYCDGVYAAMTDAKALAPVPATAPSAPPAPGAKPAPPAPPAARLLVSVVSHTNEHYGNLVTYMRLKGMVPPSTERTQKPPVKN
ncbi:MAG: DinB family protein [Vicinamibacterales bacterium]